MSNSFHGKIFSAADIVDDILSLIISRIFDFRDRESVTLVAKQWLRVEGLTRSYLFVVHPDQMHKYLHRFPNLTKFDSLAIITDAHMELLASTCPKLETLLLDFDYEDKDDRMLADVTDAGLFAIAKGCRNLSRVSLRDRWRIGDEGVIRLVDGLRNLTHLDLTGCKQVTDQLLAYLGKAGRIRSLNLSQCPLITDNGLISLASGPLLNTLKKLFLEETGADMRGPNTNPITDRGVSALRLMSSLENLNLGCCGRITDIGGQAISCIRSLKKLDLTWLDIGDTTLQLLAGNCKALKKLVISGCEHVTGYGVRCFASHSSLEVLEMESCPQISPDDENFLVSALPNLRIS